MKIKRQRASLITAGIFFLTVGILRAFNIYVASISADVAYDSFYVSLLDTVHDILLLAAYGLSVAAVVYSGRTVSGKNAMKTAGLMSVTVFADRAFCLAYDIAVSGINIREKNTLSTAVTWLTVDLVFFLCMYIGAALISVHGKKDGEDSKKALPFGRLLASCGIMTVLQLISQLVICVQFFIEYDDVTVTEKTQMLGDILWVIVEYGGILVAAATVFYALIAAVFRPEIIKKEE